MTRAAPQRSSGVAALALAGVLFGSTFLVVKDAIDGAGVWSFLAARFVVGGLVLWPLVRRRRNRPGEIRDGVTAGLCLAAGFVLQTFGLRYTSPAASAFITYLLVVMVPLIGAARTRTRPYPRVVLSVGLAVAGLLALAGRPAGFGLGEALTLVSAFAFALHIVVLGEVSGRNDPMRLAYWQIVTVGAICLVPGAVVGSGYSFDRSVWGAVVFCGVGATAVAFVCQSWGQKVVPASQAAIILLLEPVSAGILGELTGDHLGPRGVVGALLILAAVVSTEMFGPGQPALPTELSVAVEDGTAAGRPPSSVDDV